MSLYISTKAPSPTFSLVDIDITRPMALFFIVFVQTWQREHSSFRRSVSPLLCLRWNLTCCGSVPGPVGLKMPRNACMGAQRGKLAALLGIHSILAASVATRVDAVTNKSFINLAPNIIYAQATWQLTAK